MTSRIQFPVTLRPSLVKTVGLFFVCLVFVVCGIWMVRDGKSMGYVCVGFFALGLPIFAFQFHPKAAYLRLEADSFTFCSLFRAHTVRWEHVSEFAVIQLGPNRMVAWNFEPDFPATGSAREISKSLSGYESALPDTYGLKPEELVEWMESLRQRYAATKKAGEGLD